MLNTTMVRGLLAAALVASAVTVQAQSITLDMVPVGDAGNVADPATGSLYGAVPYNYNIAKYDVTLGQYTTFLNGVAKTDTYGLYNSNMAGAGGNYPFGISQSGSSGNYSYSVTGSKPKAANMPVYSETWGDAARFCNWLQNGQLTTGTEGTGTTETGAYTLNGATSDAALMAVTRNANATYFIPSENEWYKASYYSGGGTNSAYYTYPTKSNLAPNNSLVLAPTSTNDANYYISGYTDPTNHLTPVGTFAASPGPYGTYDMGGDVWQWNEANISGSFRGLGGGSWIDDSSSLASSDRNFFNPSNENGLIGFRVASSEVVPEPGSITLLLAGAVAFGIWRVRRNA